MYIWGSAPVVLALAFSLGGCGKREKAPPLAMTRPGPAVGQLAHDIDGEDLEGNRFRLSDYRGRVVVLTFWGDW
jgi:cytochrome oxidase Cu insertion factor (SCO1/SenC/PrrC family)